METTLWQRSFYRYVLLSGPDEPAEKVAGDDGDQSERHTDAHEVAGGHVASLATKNANAGDVGGGADGGEVAAQGGAYQKTEIQHKGIPALHGGNAGDNGEHGGHIGDIIDEGGEQHGTPDDERVHQEEVAAADLNKQLADGVDDTGFGDAGNDQEQAGQKDQGLIIDLLNGFLHRIQILVLYIGANSTDDEHNKTDDAVGYSRLAGDEGGGDEKNNCANQNIRGKEIFHYGRLGGSNGSPFLAEDPKDNGNGYKSAQFHGPEDAELSVHEQEIHEVHACIAAQQDRSGVAHQGGSALQVGGHGDGDDQRHGRGVQPFGNGNAHRCDHKYGSHIVHKG